MYYKYILITHSLLVFRSKYWYEYLGITISTYMMLALMYLYAQLYSSNSIECIGLGIGLAGLLSRVSEAKGARDRVTAFLVTT